MSIKEDLFFFAKSINIYYIGFSDINFSEEYIKRFNERKVSNHLSGFEEDDILKKINTNNLLENAKTFISIAVPYSNLKVDMNKPYISKSSLGIDYHKIVKSKIEMIINFLSEKYNAKSIGYCDIGPMSDREIAMKSGIGFYGKNTNIITEFHGSFVFLGSIITDILIERDKESQSLCIDCDLCIKACPVGAIEKPYYLNAKKCLSYITQKKEKLTEDEMNAMGLRIYGCDTCQNACPYNKKDYINEEFNIKPWNLDYNINELLNMSNKQFRQTFGNTSLGWRGKNNFLRNLIITIGNSKNKSYIDLLKKINGNEDLSYYIDYSINKLQNR